MPGWRRPNLARRAEGTYRRKRELLSVQSDGSCDPGGRRAWFMPGRFSSVPRAASITAILTRDINRLASLSAEGRSSATTIIIAAILRWMSGAEADLGPHAEAARVYRQPAGRRAAGGVTSTTSSS